MMQQLGLIRPGEYRKSVIEQYLPVREPGGGKALNYRPNEHGSPWSVDAAKASLYADVMPLEDGEATFQDHRRRIDFKMCYADHKMWGWQLIIFKHIGWRLVGSASEREWKWFENILAPARVTPVAVGQLVGPYYSRTIDRSDELAQANYLDSLIRVGQRWLDHCARGELPVTIPHRRLFGQKWSKNDE